MKAKAFKVTANGYIFRKSLFPCISSPMYCSVCKYDFLKRQTLLMFIKPLTKILFVFEVNRFFSTSH